MQRIRCREFEEAPTKREMSSQLSSHFDHPECHFRPFLLCRDFTESVFVGCLAAVADDILPEVSFIGFA